MSWLREWYGYRSSLVDFALVQLADRIQVGESDKTMFLGDGLN